MDVLGGRVRTARVSDPLGRPIEASFALLDDGRTAVVETAQASGLNLVAEEERDAYAASTRGTGELIAAAEAGARKVIVTVGGSAPRTAAPAPSRPSRAWTWSWRCSATSARRGRTRRGCSGRRRAPTRRP